MVAKKAKIADAGKTAGAGWGVNIETGAATAAEQVEDTVEASTAAAGEGPGNDAGALADAPLGGADGQPWPDDQQAGSQREPVDQQAAAAATGSDDKTARAASRRGGKKKDATEQLSGANAMRNDLLPAIEQIERIAEEMTLLKEDMKEYFSSLKQKGYSTTMIRVVLKRRSMGDDDRKAYDSMLALYEQAIKE